MGKQFLGIIDDTVLFDDLGALTGFRTAGAIPFLGHYRLIDFPLSQFYHAYVKNVAIFSGGKYRSLQEHIGEVWNLNRKKDGLFLFPKLSDESRVLSFYHIRDHILYLLKSNEEFVVITNSYIVGLIDYQSLIFKHVKNNADISVVYNKEESLNIYILKRKLLIELCSEAVMLNCENICEFIKKTDKYDIGKVNWDKEVFLIRSVYEYYYAHMKLLNQDTFNRLFVRSKPIITKGHDAPATYYKSGAETINSLFANGIISEGTAENSIVFKSVVIGKEAYIKNSIINEKCIIGAYSRLEGVILDKGCIVAPKTVLYGKKNEPLLITKNSKISL